MLLVLLPVVGFAALVAVLLGARARDVAPWAAVGVAVVAGLGVVSLVGVGLLRGSAGRDDTDEAGRAPPSTGSTRQDDRPRREEADPDPLRRVDAMLVPRDDEAPFPSPTESLSGLVDGDLLLVESRLETDGELRQCPAEFRGRSECGAGIPVPEPVDGVARTLVPVVEDLPTPSGSVGCLRSSCSLVLFVADEDDVVAELRLGFGPGEPAPEVVVRRRGALADGDEVDVVLTGFVPGETVVVTQCTPPGPSNRERCGAPAAEVTVEIEPDGSAAVRYPVHIGAVGAAGRECRRGEPCAVAVLGSSTPAPVAAISLAGSPGAEVGSTRVAWGLAAASLLALGVVLLVVRTDWRPPDGDPFEGLTLSTPPGWERLRDPEVED